MSAKLWEGCFVGLVSRISYLSATILFEEFVSISDCEGAGKAQRKLWSAIMHGPGRLSVAKVNFVHGRLQALAGPALKSSSSFLGLERATRNLCRQTGLINYHGMSQCYNRFSHCARGTSTLDTPPEFWKRATG